MDTHQWAVLKDLERSHSRFGVVPFHSVAAAWTDGAVDDWNRAYISISELGRVEPDGQEKLRHHAAGNGFSSEGSGNQFGIVGISQLNPRRISDAKVGSYS